MRKYVYLYVGKTLWESIWNSLIRLESTRYAILLEVLLSTARNVFYKGVARVTQ